MYFTKVDLPRHSASFWIIFTVTFSTSWGKLNFCFKGEQNVDAGLDLSSSTVACPGGILFKRPFTLKAVTSQSDTFCVKESICDDTWQCASSRQSVTAQLVKIGIPGRNESWTSMALDKQEEINTEIAECSPGQLWIGKKGRHRGKRDIVGLVPSERTSSEELQQEVDDQTKRMFYYLAGINQEQVNSHLRVVKLFRMSSQLVSMICDPQYLNPKFVTEIEKGFLFLLKEQGFDNLIDVDGESYTLLKQALEHCATNVQMVKFTGQACPTETKIENVYRLHKDGRLRILPYTRNEKTFKWGEYDIVMDAAWNIVDLVHGGCFESFTENLNLHHKFQVALEQLFHASLYLRWENPTQLGDDLFYDSIYLSKVNATMEVMDACARYLYLFTPFRVQLNRPIHETFYKRKKRSVENDKERDIIERMFSSRENFAESRESGYSQVFKNEGSHNPKRVEVAECLQSENELENRLREMKDSHCH